MNAELYIQYRVSPCLVWLFLFTIVNKYNYVKQALHKKGPAEEGKI